MTFEKICEVTLCDNSTTTAKNNFNKFADAIERELKKLTDSGYWFEPAKVKINREEYTIHFGYNKGITEFIFRDTFSSSFLLNAKLCYFEPEIGTYKNYHSNFFNFQYDENVLKKYHEYNSTLTKTATDKYTKINTAAKELTFFQSAPETVDIFIRKILDKNDIILFGEHHHTYSLPHTVVIDHIEALKAGGVTKFFTEYFYHDEHQPILDEYFNSANDKLPIELVKYIEGLHQLHKFHRYDIFQLLKTCKAQGIKIIGVECTARVVIDTCQDRKCRSIKSFDSYASEIILKNTEPGEKIIINSGLAHIKGLRDLLGRTAKSIIPRQNAKYACAQKFTVWGKNDEKLIIRVDPIYEVNRNEVKGCDYCLIYPS